MEDRSDGMPVGNLDIFAVAFYSSISKQFIYRGAKAIEDYLISEKPEGSANI
jgi:hypothetical protein